MYQFCKTSLFNTILLAAVFSQTLRLTGLADEANMDIQEFNRQASESWVKLKNKYKAGTEIELFYSSDNEPSTKMKVGVNKDNELGHVFPTEDDPSETLRGINSQYAFKLERNHQDAPWMLSNIIDDPKQMREDQQAYHGLLATTTYLYEPIMIEEGWVEDLVKSNELEVISLVKYTDRNDDKSGMIELKFRSQHKIDKYNKASQGTILFDPAHYWTIKEYDIELEFLLLEIPNMKKSRNEVFNIKKTFEYQIVDGYPYPKKIISTCISKHGIVGPPKITFKKDFTDIKTGVTSTDEYYLSHYGFAEPNNPIKRGNSIRFVLMISGIVLIIIALYYRSKAAHEQKN